MPVCGAVAVACPCVWRGSCVPIIWVAVAVCGAVIVGLCHAAVVPCSGNCLGRSSCFFFNQHRPTSFIFLFKSIMLE